MMLMSMSDDEFRGQPANKEYRATRVSAAAGLIASGIGILLLICLLIAALPKGLMAGPATDRYALPATKLYIEPCRRTALALHPGRIVTLRTLRSSGHFLVRYGIEGNDGSEWLVLCDGENGKIVGEQQLIGAMP